MTRDFPDVLRQKRREMSLTLGDVAEALDYSVSYVSDVERRRRAPFEDAKLKVLATLFKMPAEELIEAAQLTRGIILDTPPNDPLRTEHQEAALALARSWGRLNKDQLKKIVALTEEFGESPEEEETCP